jgi:hypothetical protein
MNSDNRPRHLDRETDKVHTLKFFSNDSKLLFKPEPIAKSNGQGQHLQKLQLSPLPSMTA